MKSSVQGTARMAVDEKTSVHREKFSSTATMEVEIRRVKIEFTADEAIAHKINCAKDLLNISTIARKMRHFTKIPPHYPT